MGKECDGATVEETTMKGKNGRDARELQVMKEQPQQLLQTRPSSKRRRKRM